MSQRLIDNLVYPECPRWHQELLWIADQHDGCVYALSTDGEIHDKFSVPGGPSGLGWLPSGDLLVVSMAERRIYLRASSGLLRRFAELGNVHPGESNDMVVDAQGNAWVGNIGFDFNAGEAMRSTQLACVSSDGLVTVAADDLMTPNGSVILPDGRTLVVAESWRHQLTAFTLDGQHLTQRRVWALLDETHVPDGICLDAEGCIWVASPFARKVLRVAEGGKVVESLSIEGDNPYACMLGGPKGNTLFVCIAPHHDPSVTLKERRGRVEAYQVQVPHAGWP